MERDAGEYHFLQEETGLFKQALVRNFVRYDSLPRIIGGEVARLELYRRRACGRHQGSYIFMQPLLC
jgi:hypothetical protein